MRGWWQEITGLVLPVACAGCGRPRTTLCDTCTTSLHGQPATRVRPEPEPAGLPDVWAAAPYADAVRAALLAHKERGALALAEPLGRAVAGAARAATANDGEERGEGVGGGEEGAPPLVLVPVPSARRAVRARGHDAVRRVACAAARELRRTGTAARAVPALRHRRAVADQAGLDARQRQANLAGALEVVPGAARLLVGARVILIDDLMTTGASLAEAARALRAAGIGAASGWGAAGVDTAGGPGAPGAVAPGPGGAGGGVASGPTAAGLGAAARSGTSGVGGAPRPGGASVGDAPRPPGVVGPVGPVGPVGAGAGATGAGSMPVPVGVPRPPGASAASVAWDGPGGSVRRGSYDPAGGASGARDGGGLPGVPPASGAHGASGVVPAGGVGARAERDGLRGPGCRRSAPGVPERGSNASVVGTRAGTASGRKMRRSEVGGVVGHSVTDHAAVANRRAEVALRVSAAVVAASPQSFEINRNSQGSCNVAGSEGA